MEPATPDTSIANDVIHSDHQSKLSAEEIAKALAHHKRHHGGKSPEAPPAKTGADKKH